MKEHNLLSMIILSLAIFFLGFVLGWSGGALTSRDSTAEPALVEDTIIIEEVPLTLDDHINAIVPDKLQGVCKAIIFVESRGIDTAYKANGNCLGILQITPIYVKECNRLQDSVTYTLEDRTDIVKSLEMFVIIQNYHNPKHDVDKAIHLHNPTAGPDYKRKVKTKLNTIY